MQEITLPKNNTGSSSQANGQISQSKQSTSLSTKSAQIIQADDIDPNKFGSNPSSQTVTSDGNVVILPKSDQQDTKDEKIPVTSTKPTTNDQSARSNLISQLNDPSTHSITPSQDDIKADNIGSIGSDQESINDTNSTANNLFPDSNQVIEPTGQIALNTTPSKGSSTTPNSSIPTDTQVSQNLVNDPPFINPTSLPKSNPVSPQAYPPASPPPRQPRFNSPIQNDPWGDPWGMDNAGNMGNPFPTTPAPQMTPKERVDMIERVYERVLKRKPDTRDINYYKYSTLGEDEITLQLLDGKEHTQLVENGREFKTVQRRADDAEMKVKQIDSTMADQLEEYRHLTDLLKEKNKIIHELRDQLRNPYNINAPQRQLGYSTQHTPPQNAPIQSSPAPQAPPKKNDPLAPPVSTEQGTVDKIQLEASSSNQVELQLPQKSQYRYEERPSPFHKANENDLLNQYPSMGDQRPETPIHEGNTAAYMHNPVDTVPSSLIELETPNIESDINDVGTPLQGTQSLSEPPKDDRKEELMIDRDENIGFFDYTLEDAFKAIQNPYPSKASTLDQQVQKDQNSAILPPVYGAEVQKDSGGNLVFTEDGGTFHEDTSTEDTTSSGVLGKIKGIIKP